MRLLVALIFAALAACGARPAATATARSDSETCDKSVANRAKGLYATQTPEQAEARDTMYATACDNACLALYDDPTYADATPADLRGHRWCLESHLLTGDANPVVGEDILVRTCDGGKGPALACDWLDRNKGRIAKLRADDAQRAAAAAQARSTDGTAPVAANAPVDSDERKRAELQRVALQIVGEESARGFEPIEDQTRNGVQGAASVELVL